MPQTVTTALRDALLSLQGELAVVRTAFIAADLASTCVDPHRHNREWCVVYLNDAWHRFCRRVVIASALLEPRTLSGAVVPRVPSLASEQDVLARLRKQPGPPRPPYWEPHWHDPVDTSRAANFLGVRNARQIAGALGSTPSPAAELNTVRNFIAHRTLSTARKLRPVLTRYAASFGPGTSSRAVVDSLLSAPVGTTMRFIEWTQQLEQIAFACVT